MENRQGSGAGEGEPPATERVCEFRENLLHFCIGARGGSAEAIRLDLEGFAHSIIVDLCERNCFNRVVADWSIEKYGSDEYESAWKEIYRSFDIVREKVGRPHRLVKWVEDLSAPTQRRRTRVEPRFSQGVDFEQFPAARGHVDHPDPEIDLADLRSAVEAKLVATEGLDGQALRMMLIDGADLKSAAERLGMSDADVQKAVGRFCRELRRYLGRYLPHPTRRG